MVRPTMASTSTSSTISQCSSWLTGPQRSAVFFQVMASDPASLREWFRESFHRGSEQRVPAPRAALPRAALLPAALLRKARRPMPCPRAPHLKAPALQAPALQARSEEHTYELQSLMRISYAVFC